jgi:hypothetical protein
MNQIKLKTTGQMQIPVCRSEVVTESSTVDSCKHANVDPKQGSGNAESLKVSGNLGSTEFALALFDENKGMNPVAHIRQSEKNFSSFVEYRKDCG